MGNKRHLTRHHFLFVSVQPLTIRIEAGIFVIIQVECHEGIKAGESDQHIGEFIGKVNLRQKTGQYLQLRNIMQIWNAQ